MQCVALLDYRQVKRDLGYVNFFFFFKALNSRTLTTRHLSLHVD